MMASYVILRVFLSIVVITLVAAVNQGALNDCHAESDDVVLAQMEISDPGHNAGEVNLYVTYPPKGVNSDAIISCVQAKDLLPAGSGSTAEISNGGKGATFVTLRLRSKTRGKADFSIIIYGKQPPKRF